MRASEGEKTRGAGAENTIASEERAVLLQQQRHVVGRVPRRVHRLQEGWRARARVCVWVGGCGGANTRPMHAFAPRKRGRTGKGRERDIDAYTPARMVCAHTHTQMGWLLSAKSDREREREREEEGEGRSHARSVAPTVAKVSPSANGVYLPPPGAHAVEAFCPAASAPPPCCEQSCTTASPPSPPPPVAAAAAAAAVASAVASRAAAVAGVGAAAGVGGASSFDMGVFGHLCSTAATPAVWSWCQCVMMTLSMLVQPDAAIARSRFPM